MENSENTSFTYSDDSEDLVSLDFDEEFALSTAVSIEERLLAYRVSIGSARNSLETLGFSMKQDLFHLGELENTMDSKNSELTTLCSSINTCAQELGKSYKAEPKKNLNEIKKELLEKSKFTRKLVIEKELENVIRQHQLIALGSYQKSLEKAEENHCADWKLVGKMIENRKFLVQGKREYLSQGSELEGLYEYTDENFKGFYRCSFDEIYEKYKEKLKAVLMAEFKFWSLSQIYFEIKVQVNADYATKAEYIREITRKRLDTCNSQKNNAISALKAQIAEACIIKNFDYSLKSALTFSLTIFSKHLMHINKTISKHRKNHLRAQRKISSNARLLASAELKLAKLKSAYFLINL